LATGWGKNKTKRKRKEGACFVKMQDEEYLLRKGANQKGKKGGRSKNTVRRDPAPPAKEEGDKGWLTVMGKGQKKKQKKKQALQPGFTTKQNKAAPAGRSGVYVGTPAHRQDRDKFLVNQQTQERSLKDDKLLYVSKFNHGKTPRRR
jgi:hypothetical protein